MLFPTHLVATVLFSRLSRHYADDTRSPATSSGSGDTRSPATSSAAADDTDRSTTHRLAASVAELSVAWLLAGAVLPDLIDKPLASLGVVELYHSIGHTALLAPLAVLAGRSDDRARAVAVGWAAHLAADAVQIALNGRWLDLLFLVWPLAVPEDPFNLPPVAFARQYLWTPAFVLELVVWLAAVAVWVRSIGARRSIRDGS